jgi:phosphoribosylanthranilate isomerase
MGSGKDGSRLSAERQTMWIQVAGVQDGEEARTLLACGIRHLGFPLRLPVHREDLSEAEAAAIIRSLPDDCTAVAITYQDDADEIVDFVDYLGATAIQLHGDIAGRELARVKTLKPQLLVLKSLVVGRYPEHRLASTVESLSPWVDAFITDTFDPVSGASGATGRTHDWQVSRRLVECSPRPVVLAGGLTADNVADAIRGVRPAGVDSHTGVEDASGRKSADKVRRFADAARAAFAELGHHRLLRPIDGSRD